MTRDPILLPAAGAADSAHEWGRLTWFADAERGSASMTVGRCVLKPGRANPTHRHPNCDEVLVVASGRIRHTGAGGADVELGAGDAIVIPAGIPHRALNIGEVDAVLMLSFSSGRREVVGE